MGFASRLGARSPTMFDNPVDSLPSPKKKYKPQKSLIAQAKSAAKRQGALMKSPQWHDLRRATSTMGAGAVAVRTLLEGVRARAGPGDEPEPEPNDALSQVERVSLFVQSSTLRSMVKTNKNVLKVMDLWWETALRSQRVFLEEPSPLADRSKAVLTRESGQRRAAGPRAMRTPGRTGWSTCCPSRRTAALAACATCPPQASPARSCRRSACGSRAGRARD